MLFYIFCVVFINAAPIKASVNTRWFSAPARGEERPTEKWGGKKMPGRIFVQEARVALCVHAFIRRATVGESEAEDMNVKEN